MLAALSLDTASLLEVTAPLFWSSWVLPVACVANVGKNIGYLTAGASRAAIHLSLAKQGNLADVTAKAGSQSMAAGLLGTGTGIALSSLLNHDPINFIVGFCVLSLIHQGCNYASLQNVPLLHFNRHRLHLVLSHFMETNTVLTPVQVAELEHYFPLSFHKDEADQWLQIGRPLSEVCPGGDPLLSPVDEFRQLTSLFSNEAYILNVQGNQIHMMVLNHASGEDLIVAMYHAYVLKQELQSQSSSSIPSSSSPSPPIGDCQTLQYEALSNSYQTVQKTAPSFKDQLEKQGWRMSTEVTNIEPTRALRISIQQSTHGNNKT